MMVKEVPGGYCFPSVARRLAGLSWCGWTMNPWLKITDKLKDITQHRSTCSHAHARLCQALSPYRNPFKTNLLTQWITYLAINDNWVGGGGWWGGWWRHRSVARDTGWQHAGRGPPGGRGRGLLSWDYDPYGGGAGFNKRLWAVYWKSRYTMIHYINIEGTHKHTIYSMQLLRIYVWRIFCNKSGLITEVKQRKKDIPSSPMKMGSSSSSSSTRVTSGTCLCHGSNSSSSHSINSSDMSNLQWQTYFTMKDAHL